MTSTIDHAQVQTLLKQNVPYATIAKTFSCSRERIRQLDRKYFQRTGRERQEERRLASLPPYPNTPFTRAAAKRGFDIVPVFLSPYKMASRAVIINGYLCRTRRTANVTGKTGKRYVVLYRVQAEADFIAHQVADGFMIIPASKQPAKQTSFSLTPPRTNRGGARSYRHDYRDYHNAWHLLERTQ